LNEKKSSKNRADDRLSLAPQTQSARVALSVSKQFNRSASVLHDGGYVGLWGGHLCYFANVTKTNHLNM